MQRRDDRRARLVACVSSAARECRCRCAVNRATASRGRPPRATPPDRDQTAPGPAGPRRAKATPRAPNRDRRAEQAAAARLARPPVTVPPARPRPGVQARDHALPHDLLELLGGAAARSTPGRVELGNRRRFSGGPGSACSPGQLSARGSAIASEISAELGRVVVERLRRSLGRRRRRARGVDDGQRLLCLGQCRRLLARGLLLAPRCPGLVVELEGEPQRSMRLL